MPRVEDSLLSCIVYLYASKSGARTGTTDGGTGVLVGVPSVAFPRMSYIYAVTNRHVVHDCKSPVIRYGETQEDTEIVELTKQDWAIHPDGDDLAVARVSFADDDSPTLSYIPIHLFLTPQDVIESEIGPGDETYMIGRFIGHDGITRNLPSVRFGNISMMTTEKVDHPGGVPVESFLVETRSLGGYSGSPVFVHIPPFSVRPSHLRIPGALPVSKVAGWRNWLLGIDWGHQPIFEGVMQANQTTLVQPNLFVKSNSGQMRVAPAWRLLDLLNREELVKDRESEDVKRGSKRPQPVLDGAGEKANPGPEPVRLKIDDDWRNAVRKTLKRGKPPRGKR